MPMKRQINNKIVYVVWWVFIFKKVKKKGIVHEKYILKNSIRFAVFTQGNFENNTKYLKLCIIT